MILVDVNLLVYASVATDPHHIAARSWLDDRLNGRERVGLPWPSLLGFLRLVTNPRVIARPATIAAAWAQVEAWLSVERVWIPQPTNRHAEVVGGVLRHAGQGANLVPDAHLAALAIEHGLVLASADSGFARFSGLRFENPLSD